MYNNFFVGQKVTLTESMRRVSIDPSNTHFGVIVRVGSWNIYDVQWNGIDHPIGMRGDELAPITEERRPTQCAN